MKEWWGRRRVVGYMFLAAVLVLLVLNAAQVAAFLKTIWGICQPLAMGFVLAYCLNILMTRLERLWFPRARRRWLIAMRRPVCLFLSIVAVVLIVAIILTIILPQIIGAFEVMIAGIPRVIDNVELWFAENRQQIPELIERLGLANTDWDELGRNAVSMATQGIGSVLGGTVQRIPSMVSGMMDLFVTLAFAIFLLLSKEMLLRQLRRLETAYIRREHAERIARVLRIANESFGSYISGQCLEAVILGTLCGLGMWILGFPFAAPVGVFVGATALVPIFGAWIGAGVGAFLILTVDPMKAVWFLVYVTVLQQLENNLIYPRVVGTSVGLPGIWVLVAVAIGGGLFGIPGMMFGTPVMATLYKLLRLNTRRRIRELEARDEARS